MDKNAHRSLDGSVAKYLQELDLRGTKLSTQRAYRKALEYFLESCHKPNVEGIDRMDMLKFSKFLRDKKQSPRTIYNKFLAVIIFLKAMGIERIVKKTDWPRYTETNPEIYEQQELDKFFSACTPEERATFEVFFMTGMREQEVVHLAWDDINFEGRTIYVTQKPEFGWTPKAEKERGIPMSEKLAETLGVWKKANTKNGLVFPTIANNLGIGGKPTLHFLDFAKNIAKRAGLDPSRVWLHKFRATFATLALRKGVDLVTVQSWLGHSDIKSTRRYLRPQEGQQAIERMNEVFS
jgi:integrase